MKLHSLKPALVVLLSLLAACGKPPHPTNAPGDLAMSTQQRITTAPPQADLDLTSQGNQAFAVDLYKQLASSTGNLVFSPSSVDIALAMTYAGARTSTATAFENTLHVALPADRFHRTMNAIDLALRSRGAGAQGQNGQPFKLDIENQLFAQNGFVMMQGFLDTMAQEYGAGVRLMDFLRAAESARVAINLWVDGNTGGLIPELLGPGAVDANTRLVLVNTVYFNAAWKTKFDHNLTAPAAFTLADGSVKQVPTMTQENIAGGAAMVGSTQVVELPYDGDEVSMVLLVPAAGQFQAFEHALTSAELSRHLTALQASNINVQMPKFKFEKKVELSQPLGELGLGVAFTPSADFSGMTAESVQITGVLHDAVINTDEAGTEAAAATALVVGANAAPSFITVNRPFLFVIRDLGTGAVLFMGRVVDPS